MKCAQAILESSESPSAACGILRPERADSGNRPYSSSVRSEHAEVMESPRAPQATCVRGGGCPAQRRTFHNCELLIMAACRDCARLLKAEIGNSGARRGGQLSGPIAKANKRQRTAARPAGMVRCRRPRRTRPCGAGNSGQAAADAADQYAARSVRPRRRAVGPGVLVPAPAVERSNRSSRRLPVLRSVAAAATRSRASTKRSRPNRAGPSGQRPSSAGNAPSDPARKGRAVLPRAGNRGRAQALQSAATRSPSRTKRRSAGMNCSAPAPCSPFSFPVPPAVSQLPLARNRGLPSAPGTGTPRNWYLM